MHIPSSLDRFVCLLPMTLLRTRHEGRRETVNTSTPEKTFYDDGRHTQSRRLTFYIRPLSSFGARWRLIISMKGLRPWLAAVQMGT